MMTAKTGVLTRIRQWKLLVSIAIAAMLLTACSANKGEPREDAAAIEAAEETAVEAADSAAGDVQASSSVRTEPIAALPDHDIALYALGEEGESEDGVVLEIGEARQQPARQPRQILRIPPLQDGLREVTLAAQIFCETTHGPISREQLQSQSQF